MDLESLELIKNVIKAKQCSGCKIWVEKNEGCMHMTCTCGYEFCYNCGKKYPNCGCEYYPEEEN